MSKYKLWPSELESIEFFWNSTDEKCKQDVLDLFGSSERDGSTVSFFLSKLSKKGFLVPRREGRNFFYRPAFSRRQYDQTLINETLGKTYGDSLEMILANFCGKTSVSGKDIDHIRNWLKKLGEEQMGFFIVILVVTTLVSDIMLFLLAQIMNLEFYATARQYKLTFLPKQPIYYIRLFHNAK